MKPRRLEHELLLSIARRELTADGRAVFRDLLSHKLDWDYIFSTAGNHGLLPLLHKHLSSTAEHTPSERFLARAKRDSVANVQSVLHLVGKLLKLQSLFKENAIPVAFFKGPVLAQMAYGDIAMRQAGDIDVLIEAKDFVKARALLESLDYKMYPQLTHAQLDSHRGFHCEIQFVRDDWFTVVDLHWSLAPKSFVFNLPSDQVMSRLQEISFAGTKIATFGTEDLLLYQAMHGAKHQWRRMEWIVSFAELLRQSNSINWEALIELASRAHATRMLALALRLAQTFTQTLIPDPILFALDGDDTMRAFAEQIHKRIFFQPTHDAESAEAPLYNLKIMDRKRDVLVSLVRALCIPTLSDFEALTLPPSLHSLYYGFRPLRLSAAYTTLLFRKLSR